MRLYFSQRFLNNVIAKTFIVTMSDHHLLSKTEGYHVLNKCRFDKIIKRLTDDFIVTTNNRNFQELSKKLVYNSLTNELLKSVVQYFDSDSHKLEEFYTSNQEKILNVCKDLDTKIKTDTIDSKACIKAYLSLLTLDHISTKQEDRYTFMWQMVILAWFSLLIFKTLLALPNLNPSIIQGLFNKVYQRNYDIDTLVDTFDNERLILPIKDNLVISPQHLVHITFDKEKHYLNPYHYLVNNGKYDGVLIEDFNLLTDFYKDVFDTSLLSERVLTDIGLFKALVKKMDNTLFVVAHKNGPKVYTNRQLLRKLRFKRKNTVTFNEEIAIVIQGLAITHNIEHTSIK